MKEIIIKNKKVIIREADKTDAKALIEYLNVIGGESDFLTFGIGQFDKSIEQEQDFIENVLEKENALFIIAEVMEK